MKNGTPATPAEDWMHSLHSTDSAWLVTDEHLHTRHINAGLTRMLGYSLQELQGQRPLQKLLDAPDTMIAHVREQLCLNGSFSGELLLRHRDGSRRWAAATINPLSRQPMPPDGAAAQVIVLTDISFAKQFEALQRQMLEDVVTEKPLNVLLERMCRALERLSPQVHACIMAVSPEGRMQPLAAPSLPPHLLQGMHGARIGPDEGSCGAAAFTGQAVLARNLAESLNWRQAAPMFEQAGLRACWSSPIQNHAGVVIGTLALYFETPRVPSELHRQLVQACLHLCAVAMERDASKSRIQQLAYYDTLTQLPNRSLFKETASAALHSNQGAPALLLFLDLDRFKLWNDSLGHTAGDALLHEVGRRLQACCRPQDLLARFSSDEFVLLLPGYTSAHIETLATQILHSIAQPFSIDGVLTTPNACIGVSTYPADGSDVETLLRHADQAMFAAKKLGCQMWRRYEPAMAQMSQERAHMERALRKALQDGELRLHYQPQVGSQPPHALYGVEALARWQHPQWGWVAPPRFIAVAEDSGLIHALTRWLVDTACAQLADWRAQGLQVPHVAVNLSTHNFHDPLLASNIRRCVHRHGLQPSDLMLEITESLMLDTRPGTQENLRDLHSMGLRFSMDDFGTGYSSLSYLHRLPIAELKLDKSFVQDVTSSNAASALTRSVLNIASSLNLTLVAEGVETPEQAQWLLQHGCPVLQGYLHARPMPADALPGWLQGRSQPQPQPV